MQKQAGSIIDEGKESLAPETLGDCSALSSKGVVHKLRLQPWGEGGSSNVNVTK